MYQSLGDSIDQAAFDKWREVAKNSAWKDFEEKVKNGKQLFDMKTDYAVKQIKQLLSAPATTAK